MSDDYLHADLGKTGLRVHRLGLSATYRPGQTTIRRALDQGINYLFCFGIDTQMLGALRDLLKHDRQRYVVATGAYNLLLGHPDLRRTLEKRLRQLGTDFIDVFLYLGVTRETHLTDRIMEELIRFREEGKVRAVGISTHHRKLAGRLAAEGALDVLMIRYNAAHRGAETDIFPHLQAHDPGIVSFTATRWRYLLQRPRGWPRDGRLPSAAMCYRFVLSNPCVDVCLTAPSNLEHLEANLEALRRGPLDQEEMAFMREFGDAVHRLKKWFM